MKPLLFALLAMTIAPDHARAEASSRIPKTGDVYSCLLTFSVTVWTGAGVKDRSSTGRPSRVLLRILANEIEETSFFGEEASVTKHPIKARDNDSLIAENPIKDGYQHSGEYTLFGLTDWVAFFNYDSTYRNAAGGIAKTSQTGSCRRSK